MTISKREFNRVTKVKGESFVDPTRVPNRTMQYTESYIQRRLRTVEDQTVIAMHQRYLRAFRAIETRATRTANQLGIRKLENNPDGVQWRRAVLDFAEVRLRELALDVAQMSYDKTVLAYLASYYGKAWQLDSMTTQDVIRIPRLSADQASEAVMQRQMLEDVGNRLIYDALGKEWREKYITESDDAVIKIRRALNTGMSEGKTIRQLMKDVSNILGVDTDRRKSIPDARKNFYRVQTLTRNYFVDANHRASLAIYQANADIVAYVEWVSERDGKVCPICQALDGQRWDVMDGTQKHPISDTHFGCRCEVLAFLKSEMDTDQEIDFLISDLALPETTFLDWVLEAGLVYLLQDFFRDNDVDTTDISDPYDDEPEFGFG